MKSTLRWPIVWTIFRREVRDQLRDRRTLFMIFVLPILLYPMLGIGVLQLSLAFEQKPRDIIVLGAGYLPEAPPLLNPKKDGFVEGLFDVPAEAKLLRVHLEKDDSPWANPTTRQALIRDGGADVVVVIPKDIRARLERLEPAGINRVFYSADEQSRTTARTVREVIFNWNDRIVAARLKHDDKPPSYTEPVKLESEDVATRAESGGSIWARLFPFLLVMMALTGAFYPAVDLCAGEKERGTMETLLISPASRAEIVIGKFLTVMVASIAMAVLNLASMGLTGWQLASQIGTAAAGGANPNAIITPPTALSAVWIVLLLVPLSIFFSAVCVALAVLARSMKEGQYYMTPLYMVTLPLIMATLAPGIELNLFTSLIPVTGVSLLLRALMQGDYAEARKFSLPVLLPTVIYGSIALNWAIDQFQRESVLFREAERFDLRDWLRHLVRDRQPTPGVGVALLCFALMMASAWFLSARMGSTLTSVLLGQLAFILVPPLVLTLLFTSSAKETLRLRWPSGKYVFLAIGLALALHPVVNELRRVVEGLFPAPEFVKAKMGEVMGALQANFWLGLIALAVVPAVCEEVAFRGFILSGFEGEYPRRTAILLSALLFGFLHVLLSLFQQLFNATLLGLFLGLIAIRSRSLLPGIIFHVIHNALVLVMARILSGEVGGSVLSLLYRSEKDALYHYHWVVLGGAATTLMLMALVRTKAEVRPVPALGAEPT